MANLTHLYHVGQRVRCDLDHVMPPRTTEVFRRRKVHTLVNDRQERVHRRHGQELLPCPDTGCLSAAGFC